jgi:hypothetical protein
VLEQEKNQGGKGFVMKKTPKRSKIPPKIEEKVQKLCY